MTKKLVVKKLGINASKIDPRLRAKMASHQAQSGDLSHKFSCLVQVRTGSEGEALSFLKGLDVTVRTQIGDIFTAAATVDQLEEMAKSRLITVIEGARPFR